MGHSLLNFNDLCLFTNNQVLKCLHTRLDGHLDDHPKPIYSSCFTDSQPKKKAVHGGSKTFITPLVCDGAPPSS